MSKILWGVMSIMLVLLISSSSNAQNEPEGDRVTNVAWSPNGNLIARGFKEGEVQILDSSTLQVITTLSAHTDFVSALTWSPDSTMLATGSYDWTVKIWERIDEQLWTLQAIVPNLAPDFVGAIGWSPSENHIMISQPSGNPNLFVWDVETEQMIYSGDTSGSGADIAWSPNEQYVAISYLSPTVDIRDGTTFTHIRYIGVVPSEVPGIGFGDQTMTLAWSPNDNYLVTGQLGSEVALWDVATGTKLFTLSGNDSQGEDTLLSFVRDVWFSPDGYTFSSASGDGTIRTWDTASGQLISDEQLPDQPIFATAISPDGSTLAYADNNSAIQINVLPTANAGPDQTLTDSDSSGSELVTLDGSGSSDPDGTITDYVWTEGGNQIATGVNPQVTLGVGTHTITLTVTDDDDATDTDEVVITVNAGSGGGGTTTTTFQISAGTDDVNEDNSVLEDGLGTVWLGGQAADYLGLRFNNVTIPQGSSITDAYLQFYAHEDIWMTYESWKS